MPRLADYFAIVGYDNEKDKNDIPCGTILQRFPVKDWSDTPFIEGIEWFCQPLGWNLSQDIQEPKFFTSVLTDIDANQHYCACLSFNETIVMTLLNNHVDEEDDSLFGDQIEDSACRHNVMYAPKSLVIISRLDCAETFRNCLGTIYTVYIENLPFALETLIGNILGCVQVPSPGGPQVRFSIGAGDKQSLQPPMSSSVPVTGTSVYFLFKHLGIKNVLILLCAVMTENKILFHSKSYLHLTESCKALAALMYPFRYSHIYIPILPAPLMEVLCTPTPFIMGIHSSLQSVITELLDVIVVDLDGGLVIIPESLSPPVPKLPSPLWEATQEYLTMILQPDLERSDMAFPLTEKRKMNVSKSECLVDKELRAILMRMFAQLLQGYRSCLTIIRIHPKSVITFYKAGFLGARDLIESEFLLRVLDSMFFTGFVNERGPPWRTSDAWDDLYYSMSEINKSEDNNKCLIYIHMQELGKLLYGIEVPNHKVYTQKVLVPPDGAFDRIHQPTFPILNAAKIELIINNGTSTNCITSRFQISNKNRIISMGPRLPADIEVRAIPMNSARRLEVLKTCISNIFENKISDARRLIPAVIRTLKHPDARLSLCRELSGYVIGNKAVLDHQQFDFIIKLLNKSLQNCLGVDEYNVAAAILPMAMIFCRKLSTGLMQFAYTCIQEHSIWKNLQFWESAFYLDVQAEIKALYATNIFKKTSELETDVDNICIDEPTALEVAAEQIRQRPNIPENKMKECIQSEESTLYSQAIHYANRMVSLLIPRNIKSLRNMPKSSFHLNDDQSELNSIIGSRSISEHSDDCEEDDALRIGGHVGKMVSRFIDRVCTEGGVTSDHIRNLHDMVPGLVHMHVELLESVYRESIRHQHIHKRKIKSPLLLPGEDILLEPLRSFLMPDGRDDDGLNTLPAEGALFLTSYRVLFKGCPCDPLACEENVVRGFPISSLQKEKKISVLYLSHLDQTLPEGIQLRSNTFQLMNVAIDADVPAENIEIFRKMLLKVRSPNDEFDYFAYILSGPLLHTTPPKTKEKNSTLKRFAKKTLLRSAKKKGFHKIHLSKQKCATSEFNAEKSENNDLYDGNDTIENEFYDKMPRLTSTKDIEQTKERSYVKDWQRIGFDQQQSGFKISYANSNYSLCPTYPAVIVTPLAFSENVLNTLGRCYKIHRFPVPTWRHRNGAVLLRGSIPNAKSVIEMLKNPGTTNASNDINNIYEHDKYFMAIIETMPENMLCHYNLSALNLSMNSLLSSTENKKLSNYESEILSSTPDNSWERKLSFLRGEAKSTNRASSMKRKLTTKINKNDDTLQKIRLYILGEKLQYKSTPNSDLCTEFIPIEYPDLKHSRIAYKKIMRACLPSTANNEAESFAKNIEQSEWLQQICSLLQISGAVVDLIDLQESSIVLSLEDGWDITAQISSIAQLCLDPFYRTINGFRILIEKEWIAFGHRFAYRSNIKPHSSLNMDFSPIFLQFLDAVYQIQRQFPMSFEFNEFYLRFLAYHSVSCRFINFLFDCEIERYDFGITSLEGKRFSLNYKNVTKLNAESNENTLNFSGTRKSSINNNKIGYSVFNYIEREHSKSQIFFNFKYSANHSRIVIRPQSSISSLEVWNYFTDEQLSQGPPYDSELCTGDEEVDIGDINSKRVVISYGYDHIEKSYPSNFASLLSDINHAETEHGFLPQTWYHVWENLEIPPTEQVYSKPVFRSQLVQSHGILLHKRSTLKILMSGRLSGYQNTFSHPHRFEKHPYTTPTNCNQCTKLLWGPVGYRCMDCGNSYHEKCTDISLKNCTKYKVVEGAATNISQGDTNSVTSSATTARTSSHHFYNQFSSNVAENKTHEGYLYKRGALLKGWKQRWFVLDSIKHQLRYYDALEELVCKGFIDLAEVQSVASAPSAPIGTKKVDEKAFFDVKTCRRIYNFYAVTGSLAQEWIEKMQACLQ